MTGPEDGSPCVFVVDDDAAVRRAIALLLRSVGHRVEVFDSGRSFLDAFDPPRPGCLVLDLRMPGMSGLEVQQALLERGLRVPIVFVTAHGDVPNAVEAMQAGAVDFLQKPFREQDLLDRVHKALEIEAAGREETQDLAELNERLERLTPREREVMLRVVDGHANKVIAYDLEVSERTVEIHRSRVMAKMEAQSLAELVRMAVRLNN
ncbi:MAG: DNA-binding response regulator [Gemmatimonadota bacterium]|nr:MAG: DNA-binding response regulator [Gemmatimonadota bacterium]